MRDFGRKCVKDSSRNSQCSIHSTPRLKSSSTYLIDAVHHGGSHYYPIRDTGDGRDVLGGTDAEADRQWFVSGRPDACHEVREILGEAVPRSRHASDAVENGEKIIS